MLHCFRLTSSIQNKSFNNLKISYQFSVRMKKQKIILFLFWSRKLANTMENTKKKYYAEVSELNEWLLCMRRVQLETLVSTLNYTQIFACCGWQKQL